GAISLRRGREASEDDVKAASRAVYDLGWFREVYPEIAEDGTVVFHVVEHPVVEEIEISGNINEEVFAPFGVTLLKGPIISRGRILRILRRNDVRVGRVLNQAGLETAVEDILQVYEDRGYGLVTIPPVEPGAVVRLTIVEGLIEGHDIRGLWTVPGAVARELITVPEGKVLRMPAFQATAAAISGSIYFESVDVELAPGLSADSVVLVWNLTEQRVLEGPIVADGIDLLGVTQFPQGLVEQTLGPVPEGELTNFHVLEVLEGLHDLYFRTGFVMVRFTSEGLSDGRLQIRVHEGQIGAVHIDGNERTRESVITKGLRIVPGDVLNRSRLAVAHQGLMSLGYFDSINLIPEWVGDEVELSVQIEETEKLGGISGSVAFSPDSGGLVGELDYHQLNLFGTGQDLRFSYSRGLIADESATYEVGYSTVTVFPSFQRVGVNLYRTSDSRPASDEEKGEIRFVTVGGRAEAVYPWADYTDLSLSFKHETVSDVGSDESDLVQSITVGLSYDDVNNPRFPTNGRRRSVFVEKAGGFAPGAQFLKLDTSFSWFVPVLLPVGFLESLDQVVAARAFVGWGLALPASQAYEFGGSMTIRGADEETTEKLVVTNLEYRLQLVEGLSAALFVDAGLDLARLCDTTLKGMFGIELAADVAGFHVRLDMSWPIQPGAIGWVPRFTFGFGPMF
ncbi:MAG: BamA/TamA family outer membrane protein, partial [Candidatus Bipolaricaulota bacterium]